MIFIVYSMDRCPWCDKAIELLKFNDEKFKEKKLDFEDLVALKNKMISLNKEGTFPRVFITNNPNFDVFTSSDEEIKTSLIGGYNDLQSYLSSHSN